MNSKLRFFLCAGVVAVLSVVCSEVNAQLPPDFPQFTLVPNTNPAPGYLFGSLNAGNVAGVSNYFAILDNDGSPILLNQTDSLGNLACNGLFVTKQGGKGLPTSFILKDSSFNPVYTNEAGNGFVADSHDFEVLPNGHVLVEIADKTPVIDMSQLVPGGYPAALPTQFIIQELDVDGKVIFQWRSLDHIPVTDSYQDLTKPNIGDYIHVNSLWFDERDGTIILSCRNTSEVIKISRATGEVIWRLGGKHNQFTFSNSIPGNSDPAEFQVQHNARRLPNGNLTIFDNGYSEHSDPVYGFTRPYSRGVEYQIDEVHKTAKLVWEFRHDPDIITYNGGSVERLPDGHSIIQWGNDNNANPALAMTEVDENANLVCDMALPQTGVRGSFTRVLWPLESRYLTVTDWELYPLNTYLFDEGGATPTGVTLDVESLTGETYNNVTVSRQPFAPVLPRFSGKAPRVEPVRLVMSQSGIDSMTGLMSFDANSFGFRDPTNTTVYYRETPGQGLFVPLTTQYNWVTHQLQTSVTGFGEFIFGFPDVAEVPYPPLLITPNADAEVDQDLAVSFFWTPKGFAEGYHLQVSTNADFSNLAVDAPDLTESRYTFPSVTANTRYFWRVNTTNYGGLSDWATNRFTTVPPMVQMSVPNGGEIWQRGMPSIIQWKANIAGDIALDLYKGGEFVETIATNAANIPAYTWQVNLDLVPADDYAIRIRSTTDASLFDMSDAPFSIKDGVPVTVATVPAGLTIDVDGANYTAPADFNWLPGSEHTLTAPASEVAPDGHSRQVFSSWSNGGAQTNLITVPVSATNYTASFSTQYLLDVVVSPTDAGAVSNYPAGPWYDEGQLVSLTADTNGYRFSSWEGVDTQDKNTAELTMSGYRSVTAKFLPTDFPYYNVINNGGAAPGVLIGNIAGSRNDGTKMYYVVLDNNGLTPLFSSTTETLSRFVTPQGLDAVSASGGFDFKDESFAVVDSYSTLGYSMDAHDMKLLPNGHALLFGTEVRNIDMSQLVPDGQKNALVTGDVVQEIDAEKHVVFEWHTFDHIPITNSFYDLSQATIDYAHVNAMCLDPTDNNLLLSLRTTSEIVKVNRQTGEVMWRLGGKANMFTFIGEHEENAPFYTVGQHDIHRLANGDLLYFDNGNISGGGITPSDRTYSRAVEYRLDEVNMTATLVWEFRHTPDISAPCTGAVKRFANGNTLINWGCAVPRSGTMITEVSPAGDVVFEMQYQQTGGISGALLGAGLTKQVWNSPDLVRGTNYAGIASGQTYSSTDAGVSVTVTGLTGSSENTLSVKRYLDAVRLPHFSGKVPQVPMEHIVLAGSNISTFQAELSLSLPDTSYVFDTPMIHDPAQVVVYYRPTPGQGEFAALPTTYDAGTEKLKTTTTGLGEFIFGYPDVSETPYVPVIASPSDQGEVNQDAPVTLTWIPQGLVGSFDVQVATNASFANLVLDTNGVGSTSFAFENPLPTTTYYWRVRTVNQGGTSDWASASFKTVAPVLQLSYPAGGEVWQRFEVVTIQWDSNVGGNVAIDMYKDGTLNRSFVFSAPNNGFYTWTVGQFMGFPPGSDYTLKIRSTTDTNLYAFSQPFTIIDPVSLDGKAVTALPDGRVQMAISVPGAVQATVLGSTNLIDWDVLQSVPLTDGEAVFTDDTSTNYPARFYRLSVP